MRRVTMFAIVALAGCGESGRECDGGLEIAIRLGDSITDYSAPEIVVELTVDGVVRARTFDRATLDDDGMTALILDLDNTEPIGVGVRVIIPYNGPGDVPTAALSGQEDVMVPGGDAGCARVDVVLLRAPDADGDVVPDDVDNCPDDPDFRQLDSDDDGVGDVCDNCFLEPNATQDDAEDDGVGDACDACPMAPGDGLHDEDADGVGDDCDPCPVIAEATQVDGDGDGVGDACDPAPGAAGDRIAYFTGFGSSSDPVPLLIGFGDYELIDDRVRAAATGGEPQAAVWSLDLGGSFLVEARSHRVAAGAGAARGEGVAAWVELDSSAVDGVTCTATRADDDAARAIAIDAWPGPTDLADPGGPHLAIGVDNTIRLTSTAGALVCDVNGDQRTGTAAATVGEAGFGLVVVDSEAQFEYVLIIDSPN